VASADRSDIKHMTSNSMMEVFFMLQVELAESLVPHRDSLAVDVSLMYSTGEGTRGIWVAFWLLSVQGSMLFVVSLQHQHHGFLQVKRIHFVEGRKNDYSL
jgi:hypothetical protein